MSQVARSAHDHDPCGHAGDATVLLYERPAVHDRHPEIEEDERRLVDLHQLERRGAVPRRRDRVAFAQDLADRVAERVIVVNDQDPLARPTVAVAGSPQLPQRVLARPLAAAGAEGGAAGTISSLAAASGAC